MFNTVVNLENGRCAYNTDVDKYDPSEMGRRIRMLREAKRLTQEELGRLCGVSKVAVSLWESGGTKNVRIDAFLRLAEALGTDPHYLAYGAGRPHETTASRLRN